MVVLIVDGENSRATVVNIGFKVVNAHTQLVAEIDDSIMRPFSSQCLQFTEHLCSLLFGLKIPYVSPNSPRLHCIKLRTFHCSAIELSEMTCKRLICLFNHEGC